jgi:hypothetical protein
VHKRVDGRGEGRISACNPAHTLCCTKVLPAGWWLVVMVVEMGVMVVVVVSGGGGGGGGGGGDDDDDVKVKVSKQLHTIIQLRSLHECSQLHHARDQFTTDRASSQEVRLQRLGKRCDGNGCQRARATGMCANAAQPARNTHRSTRLETLLSGETRAET